jgi:hypothetical protein
MTLINLTNSANVILGEPGPTYLTNLEQFVTEGNAEADAYYEMEHGEPRPDDEKPYIAVVGDEVRYYLTDTPGDYEVVGAVI